VVAEKLFFCILTPLNINVTPRSKLPNNFGGLTQFRVINTYHTR